MLTVLTKHLTSTSIVERSGHSYPLSGLHHGMKAQATSSASSTKSAPTTECHRSNSSYYNQRHHSPASIVRANSNIEQASTTVSKPGGSKPPSGRCRCWVRARTHKSSRASDAICTQSGGIGLEDLELNQSGYAQRCN